MAANAKLTWIAVHPYLIALHADGTPVIQITDTARGWIARWRDIDGDAAYVGCYGHIATAKREVEAVFRAAEAKYL